MTEQFESSRPALTPPTGRARSPGRWFFTVLVTVAVVWAIVAFSRPATVARVVSSIGWLGAVVIVGLYSITQILRAARIWFALPSKDRPPFSSLLAIVSVHQCLNHLLPLRLGEASFPLLIKRYTATSGATAVSTLVIVRVQELLMLATFFGAGLLVWLYRKQGDVSVAWLMAIPLAGAVALLLAFSALPRLLTISAVLLRRPLPRIYFVAARERGASFLDRFRIELAAPVSTADRGVGWLLTVAIWFNTFLVSQQALRYSGVPATYVETIIGASLASLSHVLPLNAFGSFGSLEAGWTLGFSLIGFDARTVLAVGFVAHVLLMAFLVTAALLAWIWLHFKPLPAASLPFTPITDDTPDLEGR